MIDARFYRSKGQFILADLVEGLDVEIPHAKFGDVKIQGISDLRNSQPGDISFLDNKRHKDRLETAKATACFTTPKLAEFAGARHIIPIVTNAPRGHFARAMAKMFETLGVNDNEGDPDISPSARVHPTAILAGGVVIEDEVKIAPYVVVGPGVHIKRGTRIGAHSHIECAVIGEDCEIKPHCTIGSAGFGITKDESGVVVIPHFGRVLMGDRVSIGAQSCVDRGQLGDTVLGDDVKIDNLVQVAHNVTIGERTVIAGHVGISGSCVIGKGAQLGGNVGLADHIHVGDGASIAAKSGVMHNIPAGEIWSGLPAMPIREHMRVVSATRKLIKKPKA